MEVAIANDVCSRGCKKNINESDIKMVELDFVNLVNDVLSVVNMSKVLESYVFNSTPNLLCINSCTHPLSRFIGKVLIPHSIYGRYQSYL